MRLVLLALLVLVIPVASATIYINEIVPNPVDDCKDCTEWLELYNDGNADVDVNGWVLNDSTGHYIYIKFNYSESESTVVGANDYLVLSGFSYGFRLRNKEDTIRLLNNGTLVDEASYSGFNTEASYDKAWARITDGADSWLKTTSTRGASNGAPGGAPENSEDNDSNKSDSDDNSEAGGDGNDGENELASIENKEESQTTESLSSEKKSGEPVTGKTVYVSEKKNDLTKPLILLLSALIIIAVLLQLQLISKRNG